MLNWFLDFGMLKIEVWGFGIDSSVFEMPSSSNLFLSFFNVRNILCTKYCPNKKRELKASKNQLK